MHQQFVGCAGENDLTAIDTRRRTHVHDIISGTDGFFIMFNHQNRVAQVAHF